MYIALNRRYEQLYRQFLLWLELPYLIRTLVWPLGGFGVIIAFWTALSSGRWVLVCAIAAGTAICVAGLLCSCRLCDKMRDRTILKLHEIGGIPARNKKKEGDT